MEVRGKEGPNPEWVRLDMSSIFDNSRVEVLVSTMIRHNEVYFIPEADKTPAEKQEFPDFGANRLRKVAQKHVCDEIAYYTRRAVATVTDMPCLVIAERRLGVWRRVLGACEAYSYSDGNIRRALQAQTSEQDRGEKEVNETEGIEITPTEKLTGNEVLVEIGVKSALNMMFSLLRQAWQQLAWQKQLERTLITSNLAISTPFRAPTINLPNEVLRSALGILRAIPPLSFSNQRSISQLGIDCLKQSTEFLLWILSPESLVDEEGKRLAAENTLSIALQYGTLSSLLQWVDKMLSCLASYWVGEGGEGVVLPNVSREFCEHVMDEIRARTQVAFLVPSREGVPFEPKELTPDGHVSLLEFCLFLCQELADLSIHCSQYFSRGTAGKQEERFLSETSEAYAFGSNSSSQLAMGTQEKVLEATHMPHMANCQVVEAGQYCTFVVYGDGTVKGCGKGSYGRLGLSNSDNQPTLKKITDFPRGTLIRKMASSRGSDGHSVAVDTSGNCYSWGDGNYGKLGHGDNMTQKAPRLLQGLVGKPARWVSCGNRHSAVATMDGELYTWGEGDYGRLGHGTTGTLKVPTKVQNIESIRQVDCGAAHTICLSMDSVRVWSFGAGDSGKLRHGDTNRHLLPKVIETLRGVLCQKVCASSQFSLILSAAGKVYSCGNGSGVGKGTTEPRQYIPAIIERLEREIIIDICTGDGHCLALTQKGAVYAWGTNSMGQCGQGHSTGSITLPAKVQGLQGKQIQQITAGTSHSVVWTAVPLDRRASSMWHWPYCVSVGEKTFKHLLTLLTKYGDVSNDEPSLPFREKRVQEVFSLAILSLTRTHLSLAVPLGPQCVHMACGTQVRPLRNFLFKLMDSHLPPKLDHEASKALEIGSSVLLPPVLDRMDILLALLPEEPSQIATLTAGQCRQLEILLAGFSNRNEMVGVMSNEDMLFRRKDRKSWTTGTPHLPRLYKLIYRMTAYLEHAIVTNLNDEAPAHEYLSLGSSLLTSFEQFILCLFIHMMSLVSTTIDWSTVMEANQEEVDNLRPHLTVFVTLLEQHCIPLLVRVASSARESAQPLEYLTKHQAVLTSFLLHQLPTHLALVSSQVFMIEYVCSVAALFFRVAHAVHDIVAILPPDTVDAYERVELNWEPRNIKPEQVALGRLREAEDVCWRLVMDLERVLCYSAAKINQTVYMGHMMTRGRHSEHDCLTYNVSKGKTKLLECGLLNNGGVGGNTEVKAAMNQWAALCKALPGTTDGLNPWTNCNKDFEAVKVKPTNMPFVKLVNPVKWEEVTPMDVETAPPLFALALGCGKRDDVETVYQNMLEFARHKDWNTSFDEDTIPQLRQVSCAALACLLKHTGLFHYACTTSSSEAKKTLHDVYRCVFMLRRDVFTNRPLPPTSSGQIDEEELKKFTDTCTGICATLFFFMVILNPAIPEESDRIVPQISTSKDPPASSSSTDDAGMRSPGAKSKFRTRPEGVRLPSDSDTVIPRQMQESPMDTMGTSRSSRTVSESESQGSVHTVWSLSSVKVALSHLQWQREKVLRSDTPLHLKIGATLMEVVGAAFHLKPDQLFNRPRMVKALLSQQKRGAHRVDGLKRVARFLDEDPSLLLPSSRLIYLTECIPHHIHYSRDIMASPSIIQHKVKTTSHLILKKILEETYHAEPEDLKDPVSVVGMQRRLLVALQWVNFPADTNDLLLLHPLQVYRKLVVLSGLVSTNIAEDVVLPANQLTQRTYLCGLFMLENVALRTGQNADVLKSHPDILKTISDHLFGVLDGFVNISNPVVSERWKGRGVSAEEREVKLGRFLCFLNTLSATHSTIRAVLAEDRWNRSTSRDRWRRERDRKRRRSRSRSRSKSADRNLEKKHREKDRSQAQSKSSNERTERGSTAAVKEDGETKKPKVVTVSRVIVTKKSNEEAPKRSMKESGETEKEGIIAAVEAEQKRLEEEMQKRRERLEAWRKQRQKEEEIEREKMEEERKTAWTLEDDKDDDDEQDGEKMDSEGEQEEKKEEEDVDPLDAFMKGINQEAKKILGPGKDEGSDTKPGKMRVINVTKVKGEQEKKGELMQNNQDAVEYSDEEHGDDELTTALLSIAKKNKKKDLPKVDHKAITYDTFRKNFYVEVPELARMSQEEVTAVREELGSIKVKGKNCPKPIKTWAQCGMSSKVLDVIKKCNYEKPTPIQAQAIPAVMCGRDLIGIARTGSGKTLAFLLPLLRHVLDQPALDYEDGPLSLILSPTRELALQIYAECKKFCKPLKLQVVCVYGGTGISDQIADLKRGAEVVVCTPGRMIDMLAANNGKVTNMRRVTYVVLDEADRMFDMGFEPQVTKIISMIRPNRQTVMFSATFPRQMEALARKILTKPIEVQVGGRSVVCKDVEQSVIKIEETKKFFKLLELLGIYHTKGGVLVFVERQASADMVVRDLMKAGYPCMALHGGMDQFDRDTTIADFKKGVTGILVATSVAARGLDVKDLNLVVNYDCPNHYEDYVHRCGRTGRAGKKGNAYTFITPSQQRYTGEIIKALELSGASVPSDIEEMWKMYQETIKGNKIEGKLKIKRRQAIGFTGKGFKFDAKEAGKDTEAKLKQKSALGLADSDDEDEFALLTMDKKLNELFSGKAKLIDPNAPQINIQKAAPPNAAASKSFAAASRIADKILMSKNIVAGGSTVTAAQEAASSVMKGEEVNVTGAILASQIAASINAKVGAGPAKATDAFLPVGTILPKRGTDEDGDQQPGATQDHMRYEEEIEINGFPQQIRFRITTREVLDDVGEYAESYVSVRGLYIPPGQKPKEGQKQLHLKIEAKSERSVTLSKQEIKRVIKEEAQRMASRVGPKQKQGRYSVV